MITSVRMNLCCAKTRHFSFVVALVSLHSMNAAVKPDATAARVFGAQIQAEYASKKSAAFIARIDSGAFHERLFGTRIQGDGVPLVQWPDDGPPALTKSIAGLDAFPYFTQYRVVLDNAVRILDCDFLSEANSFKTVRFFLDQNEAGEIHIADFQWGGDAMPKSEILRHTYLLEGYALPRLRNDEEERLAEFSREHAGTFTQMVQAFSPEGMARSFQLLQSLPAEVRRTRICRHYLTCQIDSSEAAAKALRKALRESSHDFDPIFRLTFAMSQNERAAALAAIDDVLEAEQDLSLYRCLKASLLIEDHRAAEAYALAHDTMLLEPRCGLAYIATVRAAVAMKAPSDAVGAVTKWAELIKPEKIDQLLASIQPLKEFCASPEYLHWKAQTMSAPAPSIPAP